MEQLRGEAAKVLLRAAEDGTLEAVLSNKAKVEKALSFWAFCLHFFVGGKWWCNWPIFSIIFVSRFFFGFEAGGIKEI